MDSCSLSSLWSKVHWHMTTLVFFYNWNSCVHKNNVLEVWFIKHLILRSLFFTFRSFSLIKHYITCIKCTYHIPISYKFLFYFSNCQVSRIICWYCDGFAQGIAGQQPGGGVLAHTPHNNTEEVFPSCPRIDRCYTTHAQVMSHNSV
jgi:hypothetical protein